jgi:hypothetical protein
MKSQIFSKSSTKKQDILPENVFWNQMTYPGESKQNKKFWVELIPHFPFTTN